MNYTVRQGDTISRIALNVLGNMQLWPQLAAANGIAAPYMIYPGQVLTLPDTGVATTMPVPSSNNPASMPVQLSTSGGGILQWIQDNKLIIGGGLALIAVIAIAMGSQKKAKKTPKKNHVKRTR